MDEQDIYSPPNAAVATKDHPISGLYSPVQTGVAAFIGGPLAGCWLLATNFAMLSKPAARTRTIIVGVVVTVLVFALSLYLPEDFPNLIIPFVYTVVFHQVAKQLQGDEFSQFVEEGGQRFSHWRVVGISFLAIVVFLAAGFGIVLVVPDLIPS